MTGRILSSIWCSATAYLTMYPLSWFLGWAMGVLRTIIGDELPPTPIADPTLYLPGVVVTAIVGIFVPDLLMRCETFWERFTTSLTFVVVVSVVASPIIVLWEDYGSPTFSFGRFLVLVPLFSALGTLLSLWITLPMAIVSLSVLRYLLKKDSKG